LERPDTHEHDEWLRKLAQAIFMIRYSAYAGLRMHEPHVPGEFFAPFLPVFKFAAKVLEAYLPDAGTTNQVDLSRYEQARTSVGLIVSRGDADATVYWGNLETASDILEGILSLHTRAPFVAGDVLQFMARQTFIR
jgi:hypothetical protein